MTKKNTSLVVGIAGGTSSGKTTITRSIVERFGSDVTAIYHDNYYREHHELSYDERVKLNTTIRTRLTRTCW